MTIKWATFIYKTILIPGVTLHHRYWVRKVAIDQYLEQKSLKFNVMLGLIFGSVAYLCTVPLRTYKVDRTLWQLRADSVEVAEAILKRHGALNGQFAYVVIHNTQEEIQCAVLAARDEAEVRRMLAPKEGLG